MPLTRLGVRLNARYTIHHSGLLDVGSQPAKYQYSGSVSSSSNRAAPWHKARLRRTYATLAHAQSSNSQNHPTIEQKSLSTHQNRTTRTERDETQQSSEPRESGESITAHPYPELSAHPSQSSCPYVFETGFALHAKRKHNPRPFPPPFMSAPSGSYSDPLSTHNRLTERRTKEARNPRRATDGKGRLLLGLTNGDDAVAVTRRFVAANDGVGAWATREKGNAALWARLIVHFWAVEAERDKWGDAEGETSKQIQNEGSDNTSESTTGERQCPHKNPSPNSIAYLQSAYENTLSATETPEIHGTTTASGALLSYTAYEPDDQDSFDQGTRPVLYVTQLGDSQVMVIRPKDREVIYRTAEQWHWFDCPRQLGTNSPDTPTTNAVIERVENLEEGDVVLAMSDGVGDNLWEHEIVTCVVDNLHRWEMARSQAERRGLEAEKEGDELGKQMADEEEMGTTDEMMFVARELVRAARTVAEDPFGESPYMERAIDEGLSIDGGKLDDISVVAAKCVRVGKAS